MQILGWMRRILEDMWNGQKTVTAPTATTTQTTATTTQTTTTSPHLYK